MMKQRTAVASSVELSQYFLWGIEENDRSVTQFSQPQTEICSPKLPDRKQFCYPLHWSAKEFVSASVLCTSVQVGHATWQISQNSLWTHNVTSEIYIFTSVSLAQYISCHLVQVTLPDRETFHTMNADGFIYSLSASERRCDVIVCWNRSDATVASLVFAGTEPSRISPERLHLAPFPPLPLLLTDYHNSVLTTQRRAARNTALSYFQVSFCIIFIVIISDNDNSNTERNGRPKYILPWNFRIIKEN